MLQSCAMFGGHQNCEIIKPVQIARNNRNSAIGTGRRDHLKTWRFSYDKYVAEKVKFTLEHVKFILEHVKFTLERVKFTLEHVKSILEHVKFTLERAKFTLEHVKFILEHVKFTLERVKFTLEHVKFTLEHVTKAQRGSRDIGLLFDPLKTNVIPLYLKTQSVPRCKHFSSPL